MEVEKDIAPQTPTPATLAKRAYRPPVLSVFGSVSMLTRSSVCSTMSDGDTIVGCSPGNMAMSCDRRLKENIQKIGVHPLGIGLYLFDYKAEHQSECGYGRRFGVMADEVESVMPEAVISRPDGFKMVLPEMLGLRIPVH